MTRKWGRWSSGICGGPKEKQPKKKGKPRKITNNEDPREGKEEEVPRTCPGTDSNAFEKGVPRVSMDDFLLGEEKEIGGKCHGESCHQPGKKMAEDGDASYWRKSSTTV